MFSLIFMKLKSHDCIPDYFGKRSLAEHSLEHFFEKKNMSNNNPGTCVCVGIAPQFFFHDLSHICLLFIKYASSTIFLQVHNMTELVKLYQRCNKNHHNGDFGLI